MRDGMPIGLGYFAVAFSLGIAARARRGAAASRAAFASLLCNASAGEYAGFTVIAASASYIEMAAITLCAARYMSAMSHCADTRTVHRLIMGFDTTDELFGIAMAHPGARPRCRTAQRSYRCRFGLRGPHSAQPRGTRPAEP